MRRRTALRLALPVAFPLAVAACAHPAGPGPGADGMTWILNEADRPALVYGVPESDHLAVALECRRGSGQVDILVFGAAERPPRRLALASGPARTDLAVQSQADELFEQVHQAETPATSDVLRRFRRTGAIAIGLDRPEPFPAAPQRLRARFLALCGG
ncbi:hypothetical protein [Phenylobacterium sp.]|uniref:hypothetical protein n=1 Tax=Phenylobacterium sp. TaxID=1871053 RepID=UPI00301DC890